MRALKKTKIICTLGPSTDNLALVEEMIRAGMDLARFNFSHGSHEGHAARIEIARQASAKTGKPIALIADTKGPEMRLGIFGEDKVELVPGDLFCLTTDSVVGTKDLASVNYSGLPEEINAGDEILLADGLLSLSVERIEGPKIYTKVD